MDGNVHRNASLLWLLKELLRPSLKLECPRKGVVMVNVLAVVAYVLAITSANAQDGTLMLQR